MSTIRNCCNYFSRLLCRHNPNRPSEQQAQERPNQSLATFNLFQEQGPGLCEGPENITGAGDPAPASFFSQIPTSAAAAVVAAGDKKGTTGSAEEPAG